MDQLKYNNNCKENYTNDSRKYLKGHDTVKRLGWGYSRYWVHRKRRDHAACLRAASQ